MTAPRSQETTETTLTQDLLYMARYYLGGRRGLLILAGLVIAAGLALNWSWLVAVGIAPILIAVLPCLAMCALGLCMSRAGGKSCSAAGGHKDGLAPDDVVPSIQSATLQALQDRSAGELPLIEDGRPLMNPEHQHSKERNTTDD